MTEAIFELPYEGTKEMLFVESVDSKAFLQNCFSLCLRIFLRQKNHN